MLKSLLPLALLAAVVVAVTLGLAPTDPPADLTLASSAEPGTLDPALATKLWEGRLILALFEGLAGYDPRTLEPIPGIARTWDISDDRRRYTFELRRASWSNGDPVTAADFRYSWLRLLDPETAAPYASLLFCVERAEAFHKGAAGPEAVGLRVLDARRFQVRLTGPTPYFLDLVAFWPLAAVHRATVERHGRRWFRPESIVSNGPFVLTQWRFYQKLRLQRNPRYWDVAHVRSATIDALTVDSTASAFLAYESGLVDMITSVPRFIVDDLRQRSDFHTSPALATYFFRFNCTRPPFDDARLRRAFALAIDKRRIVETITRAGERPAASFVPPGTHNYQPVNGLASDPAAARQLLTRAGYPDGRGFPHVELLFSDLEQHKAIAEMVQACWQENLGIRVTLVNRPNISQDVRQLNYDMVRANWFGDYNDPTTFLDMFKSDSGNNRTGWANADYDRLLEAAARAPDAERRFDLLQQAERILVEQELPIVPLYFFSNTNMYRSNVRGVHENIRNIHPLKYVYKVKDEVRRMKDEGRSGSASALSSFLLPLSSFYAPTCIDSF